MSALVFRIAGKVIFIEQFLFYSGGLDLTFDTVVIPNEAIFALFVSKAQSEQIRHLIRVVFRA